jgi:membrane protein DedA with SNARE-associated domain
MLGYFIGENQELIDTYLKQITVAVVGVLVVLGFVYYKYQTKNKAV